ncbi:ABC transporter permease [Christensenella timonensis]|uniref:ABC transporter permease n=1 Tax=Christensenella timonensis TaxID=1816678 RepID=UPI00082EF38C|nr:ABC transporter permease [Christensenella timonensis]
MKDNSRALLQKNATLRKVVSSQSFYLILIILAIGIVTTVINPKFVSIDNIKGVLSQVSTLGLISAGVTVLIISGNFDISIGAIVGFASTMMCLSIDRGAPDGVAMLVGLGVAVGCSALNGALSVLFKAPSFIITLATTSIYTGLCLTITGGGNVTIFNRMEYFAGTYLFNAIPLLFVISLIGYLAIHFLLKHTQFGRRVFAIGNNTQAAYLAGIKVNWNKIKFFITSGIMTGIAVIMLVSRLGAAQASTGAGMELQAIGAVIIGGAPINGGKGNMLGTFCGVLLTGIIFNALNLLKVSPYLQQISFGVLIIVSIAISSMRLRVSK